MTPKEQIKRKKKRIELQKRWYDKLKTAGFKDIETLGSDGEMLHDLKDSGRFNLYDESILYPEWPRTQQGITEEYYEKARELLHPNTVQEVFKKPKDQYVWELHCEGYDGAYIAKQLGCTKQAISRKIIKYRNLLV